MRGRVILVGTLLLLSSLPAFPQCSWTPRASAQFRTTALDVAVFGDFALLATGYGVALLDADTLDVLDTLALPGTTRAVHFDSRGVPYAASGSRLYVLAHNGLSLTAARTVDAGGPVNDITSADRFLFVATTNGLFHFNAVEETNPVRVGTLPTTGTNVTSVAVGSGNLYAADGDTSVDIFSITTPSIPQRTGELTSLSRAAAVHAAGSSVYASDAFGQNTDVFAGTTRIARLATGTNSFAAHTNGTHFTAGTDRTVRLVDFNSTQTVKELYEYQLAPTGGSDNVIHEMLRVGDRLYVAAGDIGLVLFDVAALAAPYPIAAYRSSAMTSTTAFGDRAWFADASGTVTEQRIDPAGIALTQERAWAGGAVVHEADATRLLTSSGSSAFIWSRAASEPVRISESKFPANVKSAAFHGTSVVALLEDGTVWTGGETPAKVALPRISFLAGAGTQWIFAELRDDGRTRLHHYTTTDLSLPAVQWNYPGIATGIAMSGTQVAVFTYAGLQVSNLNAAGGATFTLPFIPTDFAFAGSDLLVLDNRMLYVYESARRLVRQHVLPADSLAVAGTSNAAAIASVEGMMVAAYNDETPAAPRVPASTSLYQKVVASGDRAYLIASDGIGIFSTVSGDLPRFLNTISAAGVIDIAATPDALFTLSGSGTVSAFSTHGVLLRQMTIQEGSDAQPLAIDTAAGAVWVSISRGCLTGGCQNKTLVLDSTSLAVTASMTGAVLDVVTSGSRAYALFELPNEVRVINIDNPLHPSQMLATAAPARATSLAAYQGRVYVLGDRLYEYTENTMLLKATHFPAVTPDKAQQIRVDGNCLLITARGANPETYNAATLIPAPPQHDVPASVRSAAILPGRLLLLTTHSLEVWSSVPSDNPKRRAVR